jgi:hypothetical protein
MENAVVKRDYMALDLETGVVEFSHGSKPASWPTSGGVLTWSGQCSVKWFEGHPASTVTLLLKGDTDPEPVVVSDQSSLPIGTLKSILQKAVRRRQAEVALRATAELVGKSWCVVAWRARC